MPSPADTPTTELIPSDAHNSASATPKWDKVEQERLTRRAALRKMGYTSSIALFSMFAVDDLARMAIKQMEQHRETRQIAETVAKEFKNSGIALANSISDYCGCVDPCLPAKYFRCNPCIWPCSGYTIGIDICSKYTVGTDKSDCYVCCGVQFPGNNVAQTLLYTTCTATC